jgi:RNA polymerase sigma factor (sigma-70 family)
LSWHETPGAALPDVARADHVADVAEHIDLVNAIRQLPPRQRTVIALRYMLDASEVETAAAMSCSIGTVKRQAHRALGNLRALMDKQLSNSAVGEE